MDTRPLDELEALILRHLASGPCSASELADALRQYGVAPSRGAVVYRLGGLVSLRLVTTSERKLPRKSADFIHSLRSEPKATTEAAPPSVEVQAEPPKAPAQSPPVEEVLRASLLLHVPQLIERAQRKGGPSRLELDDAGNKALELLGRVRSGAYAITGPDSLVPLLLEAVAIAAFEPQGIRCLGLYFQAEAPHPTGEQTDFEDYARTKAGE